MNCTGDHSKHIVVKKDITIEFEASATKTPKNLVLISDGKTIKSNPGVSDNADDLSRRWTLDKDVCVAPDYDFPLTFQVTYSVRKKKGLRGIFRRTQKDVIEIKLVYDDIVQKIKERDDTKISASEGSCIVSVEVVGGDIDSRNDVDDLVEKLKPLLPEEVQNVVAMGTSDGFLKDIKNLSSILDNIPVTEGALSAIEGVFETIKDAHPLARAVLTALSIPYKLMKNENKFIQNVKDLAETIRFTVKCMADVQDHTKIASAKEQLTSITKTLRDAAQYLNTYVRRGRIGQFVGAQFPKKLEEYVNVLDKQQDRFRDAIIIQIARDSDETASMTVDGFLRMYLVPAKDDGQSRRCLEDTRTTILAEIRAWIEDHEANENILWLLGPPGAGKSTIAATIVEELASKSPHCVRFSCKRDVPELRNPRNVWPTLAFALANKLAGIKNALVPIVNEMKVELLRGSVKDHFYKLMMRPMNTDRERKIPGSHVPAYPVVIIDALDECYTADSDNDHSDADWTDLLKSLACWSELCKAGVVKLIVTSRHRGDVSKTLDGLSRVIRLTTGDDVSEESKADVGMFFEKRFANMRTNLGLDPNWPSKLSIRTLTDYAAGLFVWADMVVKYVGRQAGGSDPNERLELVLKDAETSASPGIEDATQVDRLYARIVFEAFQHSSSVELARAKSALATILLVKLPLGVGDLVELLSTDTWDARFATNSTLRILSPIILTDNVDDKLRVCHKTVSDFLLSQKRSEAAIQYIWEQQRPSTKVQVSDLQQFIINSRGEERSLALACMRLLCRKFAEDADSAGKLPKRSSESFDYAFDHWFEHLQGAAIRQIAPEDLDSLVNAMKVAYRCLKRHRRNLSSVNEETSRLITSLQRAANVAIRCCSGFNHDGIDGQPDVEDLRREVTTCAKNLDVVRGTFQIAMIENLTSEASDLFLQKRLQPADQTVFDHPCLKGTRTSVLNRVKEWMENTDEPNICWIVGGPGAGKSSIVTTLIDEVSKDTGRLCAKAIAKRDFEDRRDPKRTWDTLTYNIANSGLHNGLKGSIMEKLYEDSEEPYDILTNALQDQQHLSAIFIIDALDECISEGKGRALLRALAGWVDLPRSLKLVVTSRDILEIRKVLEDVGRSISLKADSEESKKETESDLEIFLHTGLQEALKEYEDARLYWTQTDVIYQLIEYAAESFIWAKMIVELVRLSPHSDVDDILKYNYSGSDENVDLLYAKVLFDVLGPLPEKERELFRTVLAFIVFAKNPLSEADLVDLLRASRNLLSTDGTHTPVANVVKELSSVISISDDGLLRIPHKSFVDFLLDGGHDDNSDANSSDYRDNDSNNNYSEGHSDNDDGYMPSVDDLLENDGGSNSALHDNLNRDQGRGNFSLSNHDGSSDRDNNSERNTDCSTDRQSVSQPVSRAHDRSLSAMEQLLPPGYDPCSFIINRKEGSANITIACLQLMDNALKFNVGGIETSHALSDEIPGLEARISNNVKSSLIYACRFWAEHFNNCSRDDQRLRGRVEPVLEKFLSEKLLYWLEIQSLTKAIHSAESSLKKVSDVLKRYGNELAETAEDAHQFVKMFKAPIAAAAPHIYLSALPFCPSDSRIARIYGPRYFKSLSVVKGRRMNWDTPATTSDAHTEPACVAFFPDGRKVVSGSGDKTVRVWDSKTGQSLSAPFTGHYSSVWSVAVSPDGSQIASGDMYGVLRVWDSNTGACPLGSIQAHRAYILSIAFSPDGSSFVTGSADQTVKVWNVAGGKFYFRLLEGHTDDVNSVAFSIDGTVIASGSDDGTIRIWDACTGESRREPLTGHANMVRSIAFSPDGRYLASGSGDETIRLWDVAQGFSPMCATVTIGSTVYSVSFSPNSDCMVSGSRDGALHFWNVGSGTIEQIGDAIYGHTDCVRSVAFAPDGQSVASGSHDHGIKIWRVPSSSAQLPATSANGERNTSSVDFDPESLDSSGRPVLCDNSSIDDDGWLRTSWKDGADRLFWIPEENRAGVWWARNTAVIHENVTKFDFRRFVHGQDWMKCRTSTDTDVVQSS